MAENTSRAAFRGSFPPPAGGRGRPAAPRKRPADRPASRGRRPRKRSSPPPRGGVPERGARRFCARHRRFVVVGELAPGGDPLGLPGGDPVVTPVAVRPPFGKLGQPALRFREQARRQPQRREIRVREVAVVRRFLLAAHRPGGAARLVVEPGLLHDRPSGGSRSRWRASSNSSARTRNRNELRFFSSTFTPNRGSPRRRTEMLPSIRRFPFSMSASDTPQYTTRFFSARAKAPASAGERRSGSLTISMSGTPARLKSTPLRRSEPAKPSWTSLPASSSSWMRWIPMRRPATGRNPARATGCSNWVIW